MKIVKNRTFGRFAPILVAVLFALSCGAANADSECGFVFGDVGNSDDEASLSAANESTVESTSDSGGVADNGSASESGGAADSGSETETGGTGGTAAASNAGDNFTVSDYVHYYGR